MPVINANDWVPRGIEDLEPNAWKALRRKGNTSVVAGPGAGKTEFLAQRATYLLETGICPAPYRVLAISFKTDAAENLARRVRERCAPEMANRFVSLTFDAFTKGLVDRFHSAIPENWRPTRPYEVVFPKRRDYQDFLTRMLYAVAVDHQPEIAALSASDFESNVVGSVRLQAKPQPAVSATAFAVDRWWEENLHHTGQSRLTFILLNRLAELLLRSNPQIARALRATYRFVFVDEFQDTTYAQYDFLLSALRAPRITVTVVGDDKQRIMVWAGARVDGFQRFEVDFSANRIPLLFNFRSSPDLVRIQHVVAKALDSGVLPTVSQAAGKIDGDVAQVWNCPTEHGEAEQVAHWLQADMLKRGTMARDYALLVRQTADRFEAQLAGPLANAGLRARNESRVLGRTTLQDLLAEDLTSIAIAVLRLGATRRAPQSWQTAAAAVQLLRVAEADDTVACRKAEDGLTSFLSRLRAGMTFSQPSAASAQVLVHMVLDFLNVSALAQTFLRYGVGDNLEIVVEAFRLHFTNCAEEASDWVHCLDLFEGVGQIPLLTVHKSKGLEYDTVLFIGLDDQMWWSHSAANPEGMATFFVALSRAKQRAIFTFCRERGARMKVADLYQLLNRAGVPELAF